MLKVIKIVIKVKIKFTLISNQTPFPWNGLGAGLKVLKVRN